MPRVKPVILIVIDGFGIAPTAEGNAVRKAQMPVFRKLVDSYPAMTVRSSAEAVGLSWGEMGNSQVGHLTIGTGRILSQSFPRINMAIETGEFFRNPVFLNAIEHAKKNRSTLHLLGLVSPGAVHASDDHCYALLDLCARQKFDHVAVHAFMDGAALGTSGAPSLCRTARFWRWAYTR